LGMHYRHGSVAPRREATLYLGQVDDAPPLGLDAVGLVPACASDVREALRERAVHERENGAGRHATNRRLHEPRGGRAAYEHRALGVEHGAQAALQTREEI